MGSVSVMEVTDAQSRSLGKMIPMSLLLEGT